MKKIVLFSMLIGALWSCKKEDDPAPASNNQTSQVAQVPPAIKGKVKKMECTHAESGAPYTLKQKANFTFSSSGYLFIDNDPKAADGDEVSITAGPTLVGKEYVWEDKSAGFKYAVSLKADSTINEINVSTSAGVFKNQFEEIASSGNSGLDAIKSWEGTHTVSRVLKGKHTSMKVIVDADGNITFDTGSDLKAADYALITDKRSENYMVFIDLKPYPSEPYPRLKVKVKPSNQQPEIMTYYPSYPSINGRVEVKF